MKRLALILLCCCALSCEKPEPTTTSAAFSAHTITYFDGGGYIEILNTIECEDGTAPRIDDAGVGHCPYTYQQQMRAYDRRNNGAYSKGVDDALEDWMLIDLELSMTGERKTNGERAAIVRQRNGVEP
jgi:hypothetical protein